MGTCSNIVNRTPYLIYIVEAFIQSDLYYTEKAGLVPEDVMGEGPFPRAALLC